MEPNISLLEERIGYQFQNKELITEALSHSSYANEKKKFARATSGWSFLEIAYYQ